MYLFYDYDGEPIYVGQTTERLRTRIRRHLTNQRTDAVAMSVLDPFEVAEIEMWPFWDMEGDPDELLNRAEFTVYQQALKQLEFNVILNEKEIPETELIGLPPSYRAAILPEDQRSGRDHPDVRLARRARTIANLAQIISEREVKPGIRQTLWAQAQHPVVQETRRFPSNSWYVRGSENLLRRRSRYSRASSSRGDSPTTTSLHASCEPGQNEYSISCPNASRMQD